tara:strand:- start:216 stop:377 length:162 start_codon:yes stop_codon:yes gene_type:complete
LEAVALVIKAVEGVAKPAQEKSVSAETLFQDLLEQARVTLCRYQHRQLHSGSF